MSASKRRALLGRIGELAEAVRQFDAADVNLEALGEAGIVRAEPRQRGLARGVALEHGRPSDAEGGLDPRAHDPREQIRPAVVGGGVEPRRADGRREAAGVVEVPVEVDAGVARERLRQRQALGRRGRVAHAPAIGPGRAPADPCRQREQRFDVPDEGIDPLARPIPFEHGELGHVDRPGLAVAENPGEFERFRLTGREQLLELELGRGDQVELARAAVEAALGRREGMEMGLVAGGDREGRGFDLDEASGREMRGDGAAQRAPGDQARAARGMEVAIPERRHGALSQPRRGGVKGRGQRRPDTARRRGLARGGDGAKRRA